MAKDSISPGLLLLLILSLAIIEISHQQEVDGVEMSTTSANLSNETDGYPSLAINKVISLPNFQVKKLINSSD